MHRRLVVVLVEDDGGALGGRRQLLPQLEEGDVVGRLEQLRAERDRGRARHHQRLGVAGVGGPRLDVVAVDGGRRRHHGGGDLGVADAALVAAELLAQELGQHVAGHPALAQLGEQAAVLRDLPQQLQQRVAGHRGLRARHLHAGAGHPRRQEEVLELALVHQVLLDLALLHLEQRRLGDEEVPGLDDRVHVAEEERQQQRPDVGAVDVGVRHQDDLVIAQLREVELLGADAGAHRRDEQPDFIVGQDLVVARLLRVDDLAAQRQHRLGLAVAPLLGRAAGRVALDDEQLAVLRIALRAVGQLGGQPLVVAAALARELARLAGGLARLGRAHALVDDLAGGGRILLEGLGQLLVDDLLDETLDVGVAELGLGLPLELRIGHAAPRRPRTAPPARRRR